MPSHTALLVIDLQRGAFDAARCPPIANADRLMDHAKALVEAARAGGHTLVFVQHCDEPLSPFEEGSVHGQLHEGLVPAATDVVLKKYKSSAFDGTDLQAQLESRGAKDLVVCGLQSEFCVSNTTRSALELGYTVRVAGDGHSTWPSDGRQAQDISDVANAQLAGLGATIATTQALSQALRNH